jgi:hypothetical protein
VRKRTRAELITDFIVLDLVRPSFRHVADCVMFRDLR